MKIRPLILVGCLAFLFGMGEAAAQLIGPPEKLEKLEADADFIFKGTAVSTGTVQDAAFPVRLGFPVFDTRFSIISVIKGDKPGAALDFRHRDMDPGAPRFGESLYYHFEIGRSYIVFAKKSGTKLRFVPALTNLSAIPEQGVLLCADGSPVAGSSLKEDFWNELTALLKSADEKDVEYAIDRLSRMGAGKGERSTQDFDWKESLGAIIGVAENRDPEIAVRAMTEIGSGNPFLGDNYTSFWLASFGSGNLPGLGIMDAAMKNPGGELCWEKLVGIGNNKGLSGQVRAGAIRALGLVKEDAIRDAIEGWIDDPAAEVRAAAAQLVAEFPGAKAENAWIRLTGDDSAEVRAGVAYGIGYSRQQEMAGLLEALLMDKDAKVRKAAAMSLLSFPADIDRFERIFRDNLTNKEFHPLFLNALARVRPGYYLDGLAESVNEEHEPGHAGPTNWWGGLEPAFDSWKILRKYLQGLPVEVVRSGKMDRYLDALEKVGNYSSSEPCDIYAFYLVRGMKERAAKYRAEVTKGSTYNIGEFLKRVDGNPAEYDQG